MHVELKVSQYHKFGNHYRLNTDCDASVNKEHIIELRKEFARPGYFSPKLELEESSIDNSSEVIIDTTNPDSANPEVIPELAISQPLSDQLLADTRDLQTLETKSKRDYVNTTSNELSENQDLCGKIYKNNRSADDPDTEKLTTNKAYVETKIETYCKEVLTAVRTVITRHANNSKLFKPELIKQAISLEIELSLKACIDSILKFIPEIKARASVKSLNTALIRLSNLIISDISKRAIYNEQQATDFENQFEKELDHNLLRLGYKTNTNILESNISTYSSFQIEEVPIAIEQEDKPNNEETKKTLILNH
jgi:hypothetical protein